MRGIDSIKWEVFLQCRNLETKEHRWEMVTVRANTIEDAIAIAEDATLPLPGHSSPVVKGAIKGSLFAYLVGGELP